jgi:hypothetical protein
VVLGVALTVGSIVGLLDGVKLHVPVAGVVRVMESFRLADTVPKEVIDSDCEREAVTNPDGVAVMNSDIVKVLEAVSVLLRVVELSSVSVPSVNVVVRDRESVSGAELEVDSENEVVLVETIVVDSDRLSVFLLVTVTEAEGNVMVTGSVGRDSVAEGDGESDFVIVILLVFDRGAVTVSSEEECVGVLEKLTVSEEGNVAVYREKVSEDVNVVLRDTEKESESRVSVILCVAVAVTVRMVMEAVRVRESVTVLLASEVTVKESVGGLYVLENVSVGDPGVKVALSFAVTVVESDSVNVIVADADRVVESEPVSGYVRENVKDGEPDGDSVSVSVDVLDTTMADTDVVTDRDSDHVTEAVSENDNVGVSVSEMVAFDELTTLVSPVLELVCVEVNELERLFDSDSVLLTVGDGLPDGDDEKVEESPVNVCCRVSVCENVHVSVVVDVSLNVDE